MIRTERLLLRGWKPEDLEPYAALNADPPVRRFFPSLLTREESDAEARRFEERYGREGFCLFAAELIEAGVFIGFVGIQTMGLAVPGLPQPAVEIGWRLASGYWGEGLATEGARAVLRYAFVSVGLERVVAITAVPNLPSRRVMERIGMRHLPGLDFDHPGLPEGHPLRRHVLYSITRQESESSAGQEKGRGYAPAF